MRKYCCEQMKYFIKQKCEKHDNMAECASTIMVYEERFDEYGIVIHDSGTSYVQIAYCPWCGWKLPESKRDLWFQKLEECGVENPFEDKIPEEFNSAPWWEK